MYFVFCLLMEVRVKHCCPTTVLNSDLVTHFQQIQAQNTFVYIFDD